MRTSVPYNFLISKEGIVIARDLQELELRIKLDELIK